LRNQGSRGAQIGGQVVRRRTLHVLRGDGAGTLHKLADFAPSGPDRFGFSQQHGLAEIRILFKNVGRFDLIFRALQFEFARRLGLDPLNLFEHRVFNRFNLLAWFHHGIKIEQSRVGLHQAIVGADCQGGLLLVHEALIEPGALAVRQNRFKYVQGIGVVARIVGDTVAHHDERHLRFSLEEKSAFAVLRGFRHGQGFGGRTFRDRFEELGNSRKERVRFDVADHDQGGVVRRIVGVVVTLEIVEVHRVEVREPSDDRPVVRVTHEGLCEEGFHQRALRIIFVAQPAFFFHHFPFGLEFVRIENQPLHAVGLEFECERHAIGSQVFKVGGEVLAG
jgi:hypothetical protein